MAQAYKNGAAGGDIAEEELLSEELLSEEPTSDRLAVIENIRAAVAEGDLFRKVEIGDPVITDEDVKRVILPFDIERNGVMSRFRAFIARKIAERETKKRNRNTEVIGLKNVLNLKGGALITANHFSYMDNTVIRVMAMVCRRAKKFDIVIQQTNAFMTGYFGFLMRNCHTMPLSDSPSYMAKKFKPAMKKFLDDGHFVLIYPEQEMWYNYKKPRDYREGAYYYAVTNDVPIIPCFTEMQNLPQKGDDGFFRVKHILHILEPIYPDKSLDEKQRRIALMEADRKAKRECYERVYGIPLDDSFVPERDIAGYDPECMSLSDDL